MVYRRHSWKRLYEIERLSAWYPQARSLKHSSRCGAPAVFVLEHVLYQWDGEL